ncbi:hypothetical protein AFB00_10295 [Pseudonocardia sp. HH130630-07]|nr:hypothetical protein AFB00_10295 [Pseudonocardia sp. HH130630-07]
MTSGPSHPVSASTPADGVKWKWNATTHTAATIRRPVSAVSSPDGPSWSGDGWPVPDVTVDASPDVPGRWVRMLTSGATSRRRHRHR